MWASTCHDSFRSPRKTLRRIMSGTEIAGLVLGAFPVVISALQNYKAEQGPIASWTKWRTLLDHLIQRLQNARYVFSLKLQTLLLTAGIWIDGQVLQNEHDCIRLLKKKRVARKLTKLLYPSFDKFLSIIKRYESCLKRIAAALMNIQRLPNVSQMPRRDRRCDQLTYIDREWRLTIDSSGEPGSRGSLSVSEQDSIHVGSQIRWGIDRWSSRTDHDDRTSCWWHYPTRPPKKVARQSYFMVPQKAWSLIPPIGLSVITTAACHDTSLCEERSD